MSEQHEGFMDRLSAHLDRGWELVTQGDLSGAMASAEQTLELDGDSPDAHNLIGYIHAANGNLDMALEHYRQAIELDEHYLEAMLNAAELLIHPLGSFDEAIRVLDQALESCQTADDIADASVLKVDALLQQGDRAAAAELLLGLPEGPFENQQLDFLIGRAHFELDQLEPAAVLIERAAARSDASPDVMYYLGLLRDKQGRQGEASLAFLKTRHLDGEVPRPPWAPSRVRFEKVVQAALRELPEELAKRLEGNLIMVTDLPGLEIVAEGVDPRTPLLLDEMATQSSDEHRRLFIYQRNIERLIRHPLEMQEDVLEILSRELEAHFKRPTEPPPGAKYSTNN
ncbi:MAG: tetratricopeptide repeat protein [Deltaproteobacteria bacterium]|nr:tetratricopeptide repeat protein [Deltaproteobacteria bacterium]